MTSMLINGLRSGTAGLVMAGAALYGSKALLSVGELGFKGLEYLTNKSELSKSTSDTVAGFFNAYGLNARFNSRTDAKTTGISMLKYTVAALMLSEAAFRLASTPHSIFNVALRILPIRLADESVISALRNTNWSNPFQSV